MTHRCTYKDKRVGRQLHSEFATSVKCFKLHFHHWNSKYTTEWVSRDLQYCATITNIYLKIFSLHKKKPDILFSVSPNPGYHHSGCLPTLALHRNVIQLWPFVPGLCKWSVLKLQPGFSKCQFLHLNTLIRWWTFRLIPFGGYYE